MQELFSDFKSSTSAEWKSQIEKDLKGEAYDTLVWKNENGIDIAPFYTAEDLKQRYEPAFTHAGWDICVKGKHSDAKELNRQLLYNLQNGAGSISVNCRSLDLSVVLNDIQLNYIQSAFFVNAESAGELKNYLEKNYAAAEITCSLFPEKLETAGDLNDWKKVIALFREFKKVRTCSLDILSYHNRNCLAYYEIAIALSGLVEFLEAMPEKPASVVIKTGVSEDYFIQIAKLRAVHRLWSLLRTEYKISCELHLVVETSLTDKSISDAYNNLLRTTVEAMAAVAGGCSELIVNEFDVLFPTNKKLSERMAVNQQLILKEESYLDKMADVSCGSYYIESITDALAAKALDTFKRFEKEGGYLQCIEKKIFENEIAKQAKQRAELFNTQKQIAIGVNKFKNEKEKIEIPAKTIEQLRQLAINNPVLNFELENYFQHA